MASRAKSMMKMDVGNERNLNLLLDLRDGPGCLLIDHGHPNDFTARLFKTADLTTVFRISRVSVFVMDWTEMGASPPILTEPIEI